MDIWVIAALAVIVASIVYSAWRQTSFCIIASIACVAVLMIGVLAGEFAAGSIDFELAFTPHDLVNPTFAYTVLTSMFMHADLTHLFVNLATLVIIGLVFEQRIGTRPFIVLYLLAGVVGTLAFAAVRWNDPVSVVGASGAIVGILGGFARLYPNEKMMLFFLPVQMSIWTVVLLFLLFQFVLLFIGSNVSVESHLGGLVAGVLLAPYVARLPLGQKTVVRGGKAKPLPIEQFRRLAVSPQLKSVLDRIEKEEVPDVRDAWTEDFLAKAKCPQCGSKVSLDGDVVVCEKGHRV